MPTVLRLAPLTTLLALPLLALPLLGYAQTGGSAIGLEIPAPAPPSKGHFLTGAYVVGAYSPLPATAGYGYGVQPYLRYQLGSGATGRQRPFVQYSFAPYRVPSYGAGPRYGPDGTALASNPGFAPLALRNAPPYGAAPYGGLGAFSVGIPMRIGNGSAMLNLGGSIAEGLLKSMVW
jgi:hypothetical protein